MLKVFLHSIQMLNPLRQVVRMNLQLFDPRRQSVILGSHLDKTIVYDLVEHHVSLSPNLITDLYVHRFQNGRRDLVRSMHIACLWSAGLP